MKNGYLVIKRCNQQTVSDEFTRLTLECENEKSLEDLMS